MKPSRTLDCTGLSCPEPVFKTRLELYKMRSDEVLEVLVDEPSAENIQSLVIRDGHDILKLNIESNVYRFLIKKR